MKFLIDFCDSVSNSVVISQSKPLATQLKEFAEFVKSDINELAGGSSRVHLSTIHQGAT